MSHAMILFATDLKSLLQDTTFYESENYKCTNICDNINEKILESDWRRAMPLLVNAVQK